MIDPALNPVQVRPRGRLYAILVDVAAAARIADAPQVEGVFGNPRVEPFGPPEDGPGGP